MEPTTYEWTLADVERATRSMIEIFATRGYVCDVRVAYARGAWTAKLYVRSTDALDAAGFAFAEVTEASLADALLHLDAAAEDEWITEYEPVAAARDAEDDDDCYACGGSGGGPDYALRCVVCAGSGNVYRGARRDEEVYGV
jgi:hypothetical protein